MQRESIRCHMCASQVRSHPIALASIRAHIDYPDLPFFRVRPDDIVDVKLCDCQKGANASTKATYKLLCHHDRTVGGRVKANGAIRA